MCSARAQLLSGRLPGTYLVRMGEQPRVYFLSYLDAESRLQHVAIDRLPDNAQGFQPRAHPAHPVDLAPFVDWTEYVLLLLLMTSSLLLFDDLTLSLCMLCFILPFRSCHAIFFILSLFYIYILFFLLFYLSLPLCLLKATDNLLISPHPLPVHNTPCLVYLHLPFDHACSLCS